MVLHILSLFTIVIILQVSVLLAHELKFGSCPKVDVEQNFDYNKLLGMWYVIQKTKTSSTCMTLDFKNTNGKLTVKESCKPMGVGVPFVMERFSQVGKLTVPDKESTAKMNVAFPYSLIPYTEVAFWIMETDYTSYAAAWSCRSLGIGNRQSAMILSRNLMLDQDIVNRLRNRFQSYGIDKNSLSIINQKGCLINITLNPQDLQPENNNPPDTETQTITTTHVHTVTVVATTTAVQTETLTTIENTEDLSDITITETPEIVTVTQDPEDVTITETPDDTTVTQDPEDVTITETPDDTTVTQDPEDVTITETQDPEDVIITETQDPEDVTITETQDPEDVTITETQEDQIVTVTDTPFQPSTVAPEIEPSKLPDEDHNTDKAKNEISAVNNK